MARNTTSLIVVDLECTCWDSIPPPDEKQEIIEIGIASIDIDSLKITRKLSILVKPTVSKVSPFCTGLTTLTQEQLDKEGVSFADACMLLRSTFRSKTTTWASFGDFDRNMFHKQCAYPEFEHVAYPFGSSHINIKNLYALVNKLPKEANMQTVLDLEEMELIGTHHRGVDDAVNIAMITTNLLSILK